MPQFLVRLAFAIAILLVAGASFVAASVFLCFAIFLFLAHMMAPPFAALVTALALLFFAIVILVIARFVAPIGRRPKRISPSQQSELLEALLGAELAARAAKSPFAATGIAFLAGLAFGFSPALRQILVDILRGR